MNSISSAAFLYKLAQNTVSGTGGTKIDSDIASAILEGRQIARDVVYYARKAMNAVITVDLVDHTTTDKTGDSNLNKGEIPKGRVLVCDKIAIASVANASLTAGLYTSVLPAALRNGEIEIKQDTKVLYAGPLSEFHSEAATQDKSQKYLQLENPIVFEPGKAIEVRIDAPDATAANTNVEIAFKGVENRQR